MIYRLCLSISMMSFAVAGAQTLRLGVGYSEMLPDSANYGVSHVATATDAQGNLYLEVSGPVGVELTRLNPAGQAVLQKTFGFAPSAWAVDAVGNTYWAVDDLVLKLESDGTTLDYVTDVGSSAGPGTSLSAMAVDATGRAYVLAANSANNALVVRLKADGSNDYVYYIGTPVAPVAIAVDSTGSAYVTGTTTSNALGSPGAFLSGSGIPNFSQASFLERISADGGTVVYATYTDTQGDIARALAVDSSGSAAVLFSNAAGTGSNLRRFNPQGSGQIFAASLEWAVSAQVQKSANPLALDAQGNSYVVLPALAKFQVHNSVAPCDANGSSILAVLDANGNLLQATYMPGISAASTSALSLGTGSMVFVAGADSEGSELSLTALAPDANAPVLPLACIGNAASLDSTAISGGELVSLYGEGLGPASGTQPPQPVVTAYPAHLGAVEVTFNGTPGPLLYVQDGQINAIAPWSSEGQTVNVCVTYNGSATNCLTRPAAAAVPGVFMADSFYAIALNQDGSSNTAANPAQAGTTVTIFATGLGPISPALPDGAIVGLPLPEDEATAGLNYWRFFPCFVCTGNPAGGTYFQEALSVLYAGPKQYEVAGLSIIQFQAQPYQPIFLTTSATPGASYGGFQIHMAQ